MANEHVKRFENKVYIRKINRNIVKSIMGNNKIRRAWNHLQKTSLC